MRQYFRRVGVDISSYPLRNYIQRFSPECVIDVGANVGQYGAHLRQIGFRGQIYSFEPQEACFVELQLRALQDKRWSCFEFGLSDSAMSASLNIAESSAFSSLLPVRADSVAANPQLQFTKTQEIRLKRLDDVWPQIDCDGKRVLLKVDTQGHELSVLRGGLSCLGAIAGVQLELSLNALYVGQPPFEEVIAFMRDQGFGVYGLWPGYRDASSATLQEIDAIFVRSSGA